MNLFLDYNVAFVIWGGFKYTIVSFFNFNKKSSDKAIKMTIVVNDQGLTPLAYATNEIIQKL